jgi:hypothetical protein
VCPSEYEGSKGEGRRRTVRIAAWVRDMTRVSNAIELTTGAADDSRQMVSGC